MVQVPNFPTVHNFINMTLKQKCVGVKFGFLGGLSTGPAQPSVRKHVVQSIAGPFHVQYAKTRPSHLRRPTFDYKGFFILGPCYKHCVQRENSESLIFLLLLLLSLPISSNARGLKLIIGRATNAEHVETCQGTRTTVTNHFYIHIF